MKPGDRVKCVDVRSMNRLPVVDITPVKGETYTIAAIDYNCSTGKLMLSFAEFSGFYFAGRFLPVDL